MMTLDQIIEVLQAYKDGKQVEFDSPEFGWKDCRVPIWNFGPFLTE